METNLPEQPHPSMTTQLQPSTLMQQPTAKRTKFSHNTKGRAPCDLLTNTNIALSTPKVTITVIHCWSAPQTQSTTLLYFFESLKDCVTINEPLHQEWLMKQGSVLAQPHCNNPIQGEASANKDVSVSDAAVTNKEKKMFQRATKSLTDQICDATIQLLSEKKPKGLIFCKHIAKHSLLHDFEKQALELDSNGITVQLIHRHVVLIRDPVAVLSSWSQSSKYHNKNPTPDEVGIVPLLASYLALQTYNPYQPALLLDSDQLVNCRKQTLQVLCKSLDIPFVEGMLKWEHDVPVHDETLTKSEKYLDDLVQLSSLPGAEELLSHPLDLTLLPVLQTLLPAYNFLREVFLPTTSSVQLCPATASINQATAPTRANIEMANNNTPLSDEEYRSVGAIIAERDAIESASNFSVPVNFPDKVWSSYEEAKQAFDTYCADITTYGGGFALVVNATRSAGKMETTKKGLQKMLCCACRGKFNNLGLDNSSATKPSHGTRKSDCKWGFYLERTQQGWMRSTFNKHTLENGFNCHSHKLVTTMSVEQRLSLSCDWTKFVTSKLPKLYFEINVGTNNNHTDDIVPNITMDDAASEISSNKDIEIDGNIAFTQSPRVDSPASEVYVATNTASMDAAVNNALNQHGIGGYWDSGDARKLHAHVNIYGHAADVQAIVIDRIDHLHSVNLSPEHWRCVVAGGDVNNTCSKTNIFTIRLRCLYLAIALKRFVIMADSSNERTWSWEECLKYAIQQMNDSDIELYSNYRTLQQWYRRLVLSGARKVFCKAPPPKNTCPRFFIDNPDAMDAFKKYGVQYLKELTVERMHEYTHDKLLPRLMVKGSFYGNNPEEEDDATDDDDIPTIVPTKEAKEIFLKSYGLTKLTMSTIARWMHAVGFRYTKRGKHYYVDGHEKPETRAYRPIFTKLYFEYELRAHRWIQLTLDKAKVLEDDGHIAKFIGYHYKQDGMDMVEYHIDSSDNMFGGRLDQIPFGGHLSVRRPPGSKVVMFIGQDEAVFKQFLFLSRMWVGPNGERPLLPKDEGAGTMISAFISREYGLIRKIPPDILAEVNRRRCNQKYLDEEAAIDINGTAEKKPLSNNESPFLIFFEHGGNHEGYWNYNHTVLQFEDTVDCLQVMHPQFEYVFLFDHSSGHAKQQPDGLNETRMNVLFGGKSPRMRPTMIKQKEGYVGPFAHTVEVGKVQHLVFQPGDMGPFWMSEEERAATRYDKVLGTKEVKRTKLELQLDLKKKPGNIQGKSMAELVELCNAHNIPTKKIIADILEGWEGKAKGLRQVLWERGFIHHQHWKKYTLTGTKDEFGIVDKSTSLQHLMGMCDDFLHEESMLQHIAKKVGVTVLLTPKCHAELAGEGIEYMWACSKGAYCNLKLNEKRGKDNFKASVHKCLSEQVITIDRIRKFAKCARQYLLAYHAVDSGQFNANVEEDCAKYGPVAIGRLIHSFKTHRCALDFDYKFVMSS